MKQIAVRIGGFVVNAGSHFIFIFISILVNFHVSLHFVST